MKTKIIHNLIKNESLEITILNENNEKIGHCNVVIESTYIWVSSILVYEDYRRQGYATKMYLYALNLLDLPLKRAEEQTPDGIMLWEHLDSIIT